MKRRVVAILLKILDILEGVAVGMTFVSLGVVPGALPVSALGGWYILLAAVILYLPCGFLWVASGSLGSWLQDQSDRG